MAHQEIRKPQPDEVRTECGHQWKACVAHPMLLKSHWYSIANPNVKVFPPTEHRLTWVVMVIELDQFSGSHEAPDEAAAFQLGAALVGTKAHPIR